MLLCWIFVGLKGALCMGMLISLIFFLLFNYFCLYCFFFFFCFIFFFLFFLFSNNILEWSFNRRFFFFCSIFLMIFTNFCLIFCRTVAFVERFAFCRTRWITALWTGVFLFIRFFFD